MGIVWGGGGEEGRGEAEPVTRVRRSRALTRSHDKSRRCKKCRRRSADEDEEPCVLRRLTRALVRKWTRGKELDLKRES